jgi:hypothetical protein
MPCAPSWSARCDAHEAGTRNVEIARELNWKHWNADHGLEGHAPDPILRVLLAVAMLPAFGLSFAVMIARWDGLEAFVDDRIPCKPVAFELAEYRLGPVKARRQVGR